MAKLRTRPRPPATGRSAGARPRRLSAGRRRSRPSPFSALGGLLFRLEAVGIALILLVIVSIPWLVPATRGVTAVRDGFVSTFGLLVFAVLALVAYLGLALLRRRLDETFAAWKPWAAGLLGATFISGLLGFFRPDWQLGDVFIKDVTAGGDLGHLLAGNPIGILVWLASGATAYTIISPSGAAAVVSGFGAAGRGVWGWRIPQRLWGSARGGFELVFPTRPPATGAEKVPLDSVIWAQDNEPEATLDADRAKGETSTAVATTTSTPTAEAPPPPDTGEQAPLPLNGDAEPTSGSRTAGDGWQLPPLDVLADVGAQRGQADNAARARLIVDTLASFGVDSRVVQVNEGPTVTQFGIEPGWEVKTRRVPERDASGRPALGRDGKPKVRTEETSRTRVRVNQITSLSNDLALALAAPSLRIESPVPGKPFVGIEVPNQTATLVTLRGVIESAQFRRLSVRAKLALALGKSVSGEPIVTDLARMPHLLIAGATGSGKSVCINSIIACLLAHASPEELRFIMIDPKRVELSGFAKIPHLAFSSVIVDVDQVVGTLQAVIHEMEARYRRFASLAVRDINAYNRHPGKPRHLPYWVVIIDELADLMMAAPYEVERQICRLAQLARATGIHLVIATQRPSVDVVTGLIKANFPTRIAFAMSSQVDSRTVLDSAGAEKLLGRGDMLYLPTDAAKPRRLQGVYVSDQEIERLVNFWTQDRFGDLDREMFDDALVDAQKHVDEPPEATDPLLERAMELARDHKSISTSMLQRRLRIGYPRAARMMDELEERGVVGASAGAGSRDVLPTPAEEAQEPPA